MVVVFADGRVYGGDANYYLAGEYRLDGDVLRADVDMVNYSSKFNSIFGPVDECALRMTGTLQGAVIEGHGWLADNQEQRVNVILRRRPAWRPSSSLGPTRASAAGGNSRRPRREERGGDRRPRASATFGAARERRAFLTPSGRPS